MNQNKTTFSPFFLAFAIIITAFIATNMNASSFETLCYIIIVLLIYPLLQNIVEKFAQNKLSSKIMPDTYTTNPEKNKKEENAAGIKLSQFNPEDIAEHTKNLLAKADEIINGSIKSRFEFKPKLNAFKFLFIIGVVIYLFSPFITFFFSESTNSASGDNFLNSSKNIPEFNKEITLNYSNLPINPLSEYDYKTKKEIYEIRTKYVMNSIFANPNYKPNEEVFGQIEDGRPWYGTVSTPCLKSPVNGGASKRSKHINNPTLLIDITNELGYTDDSQNAMCYHQEIWQLLAKKLSYSKSQNLITATYEVDNTFLNNNNLDTHPFLQMGGLNARDLGYDYAYVSSASNIRFKSDSSIMTEPYKFKDFIHTGGSCKLPGGCNNQSPFQPELEFNLTSLPASVNVKLWKKMPFSKSSKPDITYNIILVDKGQN